MKLHLDIYSSLFLPLFFLLFLFLILNSFCIILSLLFQTHLQFQRDVFIISKPKFNSSCLYFPHIVLHLFLNHHKKNILSNIYINVISIVVLICCSSAKDPAPETPNMRATKTFGRLSFMGKSWQWSKEIIILRNMDRW